jgi:hypothetical protein
MKKAVTGIFFKRPSRRADTVVTGFYIACHCSAFVFARAFFPRPAHARASSPAGLSARLLSWAGRLGHSQKNNTVQRKQKIYGSLDRAAALLLQETSSSKSTTVAALLVQRRRPSKPAQAASFSNAAANPTKISEVALLHRPALHKF